MPTLVHLKGTTKASDSLDDVTGNLNRVGLNLTNPSRVTAVGASAMAGGRGSQSR